MKIIVSPSKTANWTKVPYLTDQPWFDSRATKHIVATIRKLKKPELKRALKLSDSLTNDVYQWYRTFYKSERYHAFPSFNGLVYKQLHLDQYQQAEWDYIASHVRILDALYGLLEPGTAIAPYRLDMKAQLGIQLYHHWDLSSVFEQDVILNLASNEFSSMLQQPMITIAFYQCKDGQCSTQATYSKMARGQMLDYLIEKRITSIDDVKLFDRDRYQYNPSLSNENLLAFSRS